MLEFRSVAGVSHHWMQVGRSPIAQLLQVLACVGHSPMCIHSVLHILTSLANKHKQRALLLVPHIIKQADLYAEYWCIAYKV